jgi:hypothetical protein
VDAADRAKQPVEGSRLAVDGQDSPAGFQQSARFKAGAATEVDGRPSVSRAGTLDEFDQQGTDRAITLPGVVGGPVRVVMMVRRHWSP